MKKVLGTFMYISIQDILNIDFMYNFREERVSEKGYPLFCFINILKIKVVNIFTPIVSDIILCLFISP